MYVLLVFCFVCVFFVLQKCACFLFTKILRWLNPNKKEGSTGTAVLIDNKQTVWCANIGDSKAVLARLDSKNKNYDRKLNAIQISKDHNVLSLQEMKRIEKYGGYIANGRVNGSLEVTRSFGDPEFKKYGVVAIPRMLQHYTQKKTKKLQKK